MPAGWRCTIRWKKPSTITETNIRPSFGGNSNPSKIPSFRISALQRSSMLPYGKNAPNGKGRRNGRRRCDIVATNEYILTITAYENPDRVSEEREIYRILRRKVRKRTFRPLRLLVRSRAFRLKPLRPCPAGREPSRRQTVAPTDGGMVHEEIPDPPNVRFHRPLPWGRGTDIGNFIISLSRLWENSSPSAQSPFRSCFRWETPLLFETSKPLLPSSICRE